MLHAPLGQAVRRALLATTLVGAAPAVLAQEAQAPRTLDRIVVTGSNIPRTDTETASPVQVITR